MDVPKCSFLIGLFSPGPGEQWRPPAHVPDAVQRVAEEAERGERGAADGTRTAVQWRYDPLCPSHVDRWATV